MGACTHTQHYALFLPITIQLWVTALEAGKFELGGGFDHWLCGGEERDGALLAVPGPELLTSDHQLTVDTLTHV